MSKYTAIGAGPSADLITVRGLRALKAADMILYDRLADAELLDECRAKKIFVGKQPYACTVRQAEINRLIGEHLAKGRSVARLKGGDSVIFSRVMEEIATARECGAEIEIIPGVTAASAAAAKVELALTDREYASGVVYITGHQKGGMPEYDWKAIAANNFTVVVYMGAKYIGHIVESLMEGGMDKDMPVLAATDIGHDSESYRLFKAGDITGSAINPAGSATVFIIGNVLKNLNTETGLETESVIPGLTRDLTR